MWRPVSLFVGDKPGQGFSGREGHQGNIGEMIKKAAVTVYDAFLAVLFFGLMVLGYGVYSFLYPFYRFGRVFRIICLLFFTFAFMLLAGYLLMNYEARQKRTDRDYSETILRVNKGSTLDDITALLTQYGIIDAPLQFKLVAALKGASKRMKAGSYVFNTQMSIQEIIDRIATGKTFSTRISIPEGSTSFQIAALLQERLGVDSAAFMAAVNDTVLAASLGIRSPSLEGFLFPETYRFEWRADPRFIAAAMVRRFGEVWYRNQPPHLSVRRYRREQIVTMASIVEAEAIVASERPLIAGVFYNRLKKGMPLGADPTVRYALQKYAGRQLTKSDLAVASPYNTRKFKGLPPGPIGNPGEAAIWAALNPIVTPMLYFVAKYDGTYGHYFSATHEEHTRSKKQSRENSRIRALEKTEQRG